MSMAWFKMGCNYRGPYLVSTKAQTIGQIQRHSGEWNGIRRGINKASLHRSIHLSICNKRLKLAVNFDPVNHVLLFLLDAFFS
jgi:hypothetical protein